MFPWIARKVRVALPIELAVDMFLHAHQWDRERGGRYEGYYDPCGVAIRIWPAIGVSEERPAVLLGEADFHWRTPFDGAVTLYRIGWDPLEGGSEALVWDALETLAGHPLRPKAAEASTRTATLPTW